MSLRTSFSNLPIATKLNVVQSVTLVALFVIAITWLAGWTKERTVEDSAEVARQINSQLVSMVQVLNATLERNIARTNSILKDSMPSSTYTLDTTQRVMVAGVSTPVLRSGNETLNNNFTVVDSFSTTAHAVATVFARDGDDFIRITTSLKNASGERALGTKLSRDHPAYKAILANQSFAGKAQLFGIDYMTSYLPIQNASGAVVGALFVGHDFSDELSALKQQILNIKFEKSGHMFILDAGDNPGEVVVHPTLTGQNIYDEKDSKGTAYVHEIIEKKEGSLRYWPTRNENGRTVTRERIATFKIIPEWKWIVVSSLVDEELAEHSIGVRNRLIAGAIGLCVLLFAVIFVSSRRWITRPLTEAVHVLEKIADGHLNFSIPDYGNDEVGRLLSATNVMCGKMRSSLGDIQNAAEKLTQSAHALVSSADDVLKQSEQQSDAAMGTAASVEEMQVSIDLVSNNAEQANQISADSDHVSSEGAVIIQQASDSISRIADTVRTASSVVSELEQESQAISNIVNVISDIADQTNLLALNAAIEAARAGEQGRGFAVVADEVRKLAERTSSSTHEIGALIGRISEGTANAVASMGEGVQQVEEGVSYAVKAGESITSIRKSADQVVEAVTNISNALTKQTSAIAEIASNVEKIAQMADQNSHAAKESAQHAVEQEQLAQRLRESISHFHI